MIKVIVAVAMIASSAIPAAAQQVVTGQAAFADWNQQQPGVRRKITAADLPAPAPKEAVDNGPHLIPRPKDAWPIAPAGFKVTLYAGGDFTPTAASSSQDHKPAAVPVARSTFREPRLLRTAPNGDIFLSDSHGDKIFVLRGVGPDGKAKTISTFATGLNLPFGINFYPAGPNPKWVYVGNTDSVVRFPYKSGDLVATGPAKTVIAQLPGFAQLRGGGHWTRDIVFTPDGSKMLVSVGSASNIDNPDTSSKEFHRADVLEFTPEGKFLKVYASGIRNCVGEAINPTTGQLWCSTNERDNLGNHLVPDYVTSVKEDGFYGWPWYYIGSHSDPRLPAPCADGIAAKQQAAAISPDGGSCKRVDLSSKVIVPDVLVQPHMASLEMIFYTNPSGFSREYFGDAFAAEHGSWNRANRAGYEVIRIPMHNGKADGTYEDFLTGFVTKDGGVWGRPVGITIAQDGSMFVTDDGSRSVWHVTYIGNNTQESH
ncbi:sorbosone dehydrogenase family protein [Granulicella mallensis]|uniref:Glucose/arabinose dehydrogenase n=1 Tax=Granulicella mallensis TaxID=940614 RepID=A0A7W7ZPE9_9BACT|nr:PQQ-dependent sugar dehydrogenase [Granulicella mallensis]MBB5063638.1 glucose/arabinose dehydrogenase [Granulicella mallensis]